MKINKRGALNGGTVEAYTMTFIILVVLFLIIAELLPEAQTAGDAINTTGAPLSGLFASSGVVWVIVMAGIVLLVLRAALKKK